MDSVKWHMKLMYEWGIKPIKAAKYDELVGILRENSEDN